MQLASQQFESKDVKVQVLLTGGHQYTVYLKSDAPILHSLLTTVVARAYKQESELQNLFQIPINEGRSVLCFPSEHLIGVVTEPPIFVQQSDKIQLQNDYILASDYIQIDNFLKPEEHKNLVEYILKKESDFLPSNTSTNDINYRQSMVIYSFPEFSELILKRIQAMIPDILSKLNLPSFSVSQIESQLTAHNDGNYYKLHNDNGSSDTATRELTYVYYFYQEPKSFSGGELLIYDSKIENNVYVNAETFKTVEPRNNSIVFFLSRYMHEVLPVNCPSQAFGDSRFTINGWVRR
ncbi:MAG: 2OG-Fe(II) oxygenase [Nostoc sp. DedQUE08]|uniref:2OG-Fe(II) oxygenase n=1 Tax=unclassified Nostoc TaxID=2593658 RepID=UPI002AD565A0|nr:MULTISPECIES: 2OG-Fe(II) oxygenase [unclassified Nostoc]MDZ8068953.1 2OG-Fe(II) oxygenase [Nostoc sp. DedQUE08]MDZ8095659.1 2OG-Fe(II) oxygenase [Nostoc sp. DedQUE05]MDZ8137051.1 2OG-Fe(II) oxygenase [Nostoc sp. DedQUE04]